MTERPRVRDLGLAPGGLPTGPRNAIADVPGVVVGHATLLEGDDVRTGVTAVRVAGRDLFREPPVGAVHVINGFGKSLGLMQVQELGRIETPIAVTNTLSVWTAAEALVDWTLRENDPRSINPVVGECNDGLLNDIVGRHVTREHVLAALEAAGPETAEGNVGAGTGTTGFGYKAGVGTASRLVATQTGSRVVGVLVVCNTGAPGELTLAGVPVGRELRRVSEAGANEDGSIIIVMGTDAPLTARQLGRMARRTTHGLARTGCISSHGSGDVAVGFSVAEPLAGFDEGRDITALFRATVEATEEAIGNAVVRSETMTGRGGRTVEALDLEALSRVLASGTTLRG